MSEISQQVARQLIESYREHGGPLPDGLHPMDKAGVELIIWVGWQVLPGGRGPANYVCWDIHSIDRRRISRGSGGTVMPAIERHFQIARQVYRREHSQGFCSKTAPPWKDLSQTRSARRPRAGGAACLSEGIHNHPTAVLQSTAPRARRPVRRQGPWRGRRSACRTCRQTARTDPGRLRNGRGVFESRRVADRRWRGRGRRRCGSG